MLEDVVEFEDSGTPGVSNVNCGKVIIHEKHVV
jgi:hypothetical protein